MHPRYLRMTLLLGLVVLAAAVQAETLTQVLSEAAKSNQGVRAAQAKWQAAQEEAAQQGWWPNPMLKLSALNLPEGQWDFQRTPMSGKQLAITQKVPFWKTPLRHSAAQYRSQAARLEWQTRLWKVRQEVSGAYDQLLYLQQAAQIVQQNRDLIQKLVKVASVKYAGGNGLQQDVLRAKVELALLDNQLLEIKEKQKNGTENLTSLAGREQNDPVLVEGNLQWHPRALDRKALAQKAMQNNPQLLQLQQAMESSRVQNTLADWSWVPDLELSGYYTWRDEVHGDPVAGQDFVGLSLGVEIPLWFFAHQLPAAREARARLDQSSAACQDWKDTLGAQVQASLDRLERIAASEQLYATMVLPQAKAALESSVTAYQTGRVDFLTVVNNETLLVQHQLKYWKIVSDYEAEVAVLESLVAEELP